MSVVSKRLQLKTIRTNAQDLFQCILDPALNKGGREESPGT